MADIEPPSFSLGLDLDIEPKPKPKPKPELSSARNDDTAEESQWWVPDSDPDSGENPPPSRLRRLRRGGSRRTVECPGEVGPVLGTPKFVEEDDIEDFSEEDKDHFPVSQHQTLCSSSKLPLSGCGVLTRQQRSTTHNHNNSDKKEESSCPPASIASNKGKSVFPDFTSSPLRRFQLLDSDSDDPSEDVHVSKNACGSNLSKNIMQEKLKTDMSASTSQKQDLWKDFCVDKNISVPTPVFDELLEEYYEHGKQNKAVIGSREFGSTSKGSSINDASNFMENRVDEATETADLPCHRYFFNNDVRIQRLVRSRLPYFSPLRVSVDTGNMPCSASSIDYRSQFGNGDGAKQRARRTPDVENSSKRVRKRNKKANTEDNLHTAETWIDPKQTANTPKDAGKRRVHADGQSSGHWFTGDNGKKVYVSRTGKEMTGRLAYMNYKKENGGFRKSGKKRTSKKK